MLSVCKIQEYASMFIEINRNFRKRTIRHVRLAKIQISLRVRAVWSESSLGAFWIAKDARFDHEDNIYSDQSARMRRLIWVFVWRTYQKVPFLTLLHKGLSLIYCQRSTKRELF